MMENLYKVKVTKVVETTVDYWVNAADEEVAKSKVQLLADTRSPGLLEYIKEYVTNKKVETNIRVGEVKFVGQEKV